jgi:hypothetical protein
VSYVAFDNYGSGCEGIGFSVGCCNSPAGMPRSGTFTIYLQAFYQGGFVYETEYHSITLPQCTWDGFIP